MPCTRMSSMVQQHPTNTIMHESSHMDTRTWDCSNKEVFVRITFCAEHSHVLKSYIPGLTTSPTFVVAVLFPTRIREMGTTLGTV